MQERLSDVIANDISIYESGLQKMGSVLNSKMTAIFQHTPQFAMFSSNLKQISLYSIKAIP